MTARWNIPARDRPAERALSEATGCGALAACVLLRRGFGEPAAAARFLRPSLDDLHDPYLLTDMRAAVERLAAAIHGREKILIYGDYDADGTTAVVILRKAIGMAGGESSFHVPHRLRDGYGMRPEAVDRAAAEGVRLIVSVDTGIRAGDVVRQAARLGIDVIVTDHHLPEAELPPALAVLNPNRPDCAYPGKVLCGAGVALQLARALLGTLGWPAEKLRATTESFLKMAAIATVADAVPLTGENRAIVKHGLAGLRDVRNPGLRALLDVAGFERGTAPTAGQAAFRIAPRINAAGRMACAAEVIELFCTADAARARQIAAGLHAQNELRQRTESGILRAALDECSRTPVTDAQAALVFSGDGWHRGVLGIVASRLVERFHRPVIVLGVEDGVAKGSGRGTAGFHLLEALEAMPDLFLGFGGHVQAAGVALPASRVAEFRERFNAFASARLTPEDFRPRFEIDAVVEVGELDEMAVDGVMALAPFGAGNPAPLLMARDLEVARPPAVLKEKHLKLLFDSHGRQLAATAWDFAARAAELAPGARVDAVFHVEHDDYARRRGLPAWAAVLRDVRPSEPS